MTAHRNSNGSRSSRHKSKSPIHALTELLPGHWWLVFLFALFMVTREVGGSLIDAVQPFVAGDSTRGFVLGLLSGAPAIGISSWLLIRDAQTPLPTRTKAAIGLVLFVSLLYFFLFIPVSNRPGSVLGGEMAALKNQVFNRLPGATLGALAAALGMMLIPPVALRFAPARRDPEAREPSST